MPRFSALFRNIYDPIKDVIRSDDFLQQARTQVGDFSRQRDLPLSRLVPLRLNFRKGTLRNELDQAFEVLQEAQPNVKPVTPAALCRARQKLNPHALVWLNDRLVDLASQQLGERRWQGLRVLAVDGSTARLPSTPQIAAHFGHRKGDGVPLARWSTLYDVVVVK